MSDKDTTGRVYGGAYPLTEHMSFPELMDEMYSKLVLSPATWHVPAGTEFALHHNGEAVVVLKVLRLADTFQFQQPNLWTDAAQGLYDSMEEFFEAFNWVNPDDGMDRRFFHSVHLLSEYAQGNANHPAGIFLHPKG